MPATRSFAVRVAILGGGARAGTLLSASVRAMGEMIEFPSNGGRASGYLASPSGGGPGVVVIQEWWGLVGHITAVCDRFAAEGFVALAPDLYHGQATTEPDDAARLMMALRIEEAAKDLSGAVDAVVARSSGRGVGVVGFCMGGGLALLAGVRRADVVRAVVPFYGLIPWPGVNPDWSEMRAAVQGHYAEHDDFAGPAAARQLESTFRTLGLRSEFFVYPGTEHAFFNDDRPEVYAPEAAALAWQRTLAFLREELT